MASDYGFIMKLAYQGFRPVLVDWMNKRALHIPEVKAVELGKKFGVPVEVIRALEAQLVYAFIKMADKAITGKEIPLDAPQ